MIQETIYDNINGPLAGPFLIAGPFMQVTIHIFVIFYYSINPNASYLYILVISMVHVVSMVLAIVCPFLLCSFMCIIVYRLVLCLLVVCGYSCKYMLTAGALNK